MRWPLLLPLCLLAACAGPRPVLRLEAPAVAPPPAVSEAPPVLVPEPERAVPVPEERAPDPSGEAGEAERSRVAAAIVERAVQLLGMRHLGGVDRSVPDDCSGFVRIAYGKGGIDLTSLGFLSGENAVSAFYRRAQLRGALHDHRPQAGDLAFFRETYDRNRDGRRNDGMTHVAIVESVDAQGTITFIHRGAKGIARSRMNLTYPRSRRAGQDGPVLNDFLRAASRGQRAWLAGELFAGFASSTAL